MTPDWMNRRSALRWLFVIQLVSMGAMEMSGPFWPLHLRTLGQLDKDALAWASAFAYAGPMFAAMCFTSSWGRIGDRIGHKPMVLRALLALAATQAWIATADSVASILSARLLQGALAGFIAAAQAYGASIVPHTERGRLMARLQVATAAGSVLGPMAGGLFYEHAGFRTLNFIAAMLCMACAGVATVALPNIAPSRSAPKPVREQAQPFMKSGLLGLLIAILLVQTGKMMPQAFFGLYVEQVLRLPAWLVGLCYGATALGLCLAAPLWARRFDNRSRHAVLAQVELVCWASAAIVAVQAISRDMVLFLLARLLWGICMAALLPVFYALMSRDAPSAEQGRVLGLSNGAAKAGALAGAATGGLALIWLPIEHAFWPVVGLYLLAALALRRIRQRGTDASLDAVESACH